MSTMTQTNQQLILLMSLLVFVAFMLWMLQYLTVRYGRSAFNQLTACWQRIEKLSGFKKILARFKETHPKLYNFIWERLHIQHFYGLPLTALFLVASYIMALFIGLVEDVVTSDSIVIVDHFVSQQMSLLSESTIIKFFILITSLGSTPVTSLVILLTGVLCWIIGQRYIAIGLIVTTLGSTTFTYLSKLLFNRERPEDILLFEQTYSFPSGHATIAIALYGFIGYLAVRFNEDFNRKIRIIVTTIFLCLLIGLSRIVLNEHYLSDVLGGYLVGTLWLIVGISVTEWLGMKNKINWYIAWTTTEVRLVWIGIITVLIGTFVFAYFYQFPLLT